MVLLKAEYNALLTKNNEITDNLFSLNQRATKSMTQVNQLRETLKTLKAEKDSLEKEIYEKEVASKNKSKDKALDPATIKKAIKDYQASFIDMATTFLYIPYNEAGITKIAIPAFDKSKGSPYYEKYQIRLTLLQHYKKNTEDLIKYLQNSQPELEELNKSIQAKDYNMIPYKINKLKSEFYKLNSISEYKDYGEGWQDTYLGDILYGIENLLSYVFNNETGPTLDINRVKDIPEAYNNYLKQLQ